jgi:CBS domain-containing protein
MGHIRKLMFVKPRTVKIGDSVVDAAKLMKGEETGVAPIVEEGRLVGVVTDRDITIRVVAEGRDPSTTKVEDVASRDLVTVDPDQDLGDALALMTEHRVKGLPVVEEDGTLVGIVARADVVRHLEAEQPEYAFADFSE